MLSKIALPDLICKRNVQLKRQKRASNCIRRGYIYSRATLTIIFYPPSIPTKPGVQ